MAALQIGAAFDPQGNLAVVVVSDEYEQLNTKDFAQPEHICVNIDATQIVGQVTIDDIPALAHPILGQSDPVFARSVLDAPVIAAQAQAAAWAQTQLDAQIAEIQADPVAFQAAIDARAQALGLQTIELQPELQTTLSTALATVNVSPQPSPVQAAPPST